jgi:hypothetical protein
MKHDDRRAVFVHNEQHSELLWKSWRWEWARTDGPSVLFHRNANRISIRAAIAMQLAVPASAVELRGST